MIIESFTLRDVVIVGAVFLVALISRHAFRKRALAFRKRVVLSVLALVLLGLWCGQASESSSTAYCILGFGCFVLVASLIFLRRFEKKTLEEKKLGSG